MPVLLTCAGDAFPGENARERLVELRDALGLRDVVELQTHVEDVSAFLKNCHVVVLASGRKSEALCLREALAAGRPTDTAGAREVVGHSGAALLTPIGDPGAMALALRQLWLDPQRRERMAESGLAYSSRTSHDTEALLALYDELLARRGATLVRGDVGAVRHASGTSPRSEVSNAR